MAFYGIIFCNKYICQMKKLLLKRKYLYIVIPLAIVSVITVVIFNNNFNSYYHKQKQISKDFVVVFNSDTKDESNNQAFHETNAKKLMEYNNASALLEESFGNMYPPWEEPRAAQIKAARKQMNTSAYSYQRFVKIAGKIFEADGLFNQLWSEKNQLQASIYNGTNADLTNRMQGNCRKLADLLSEISNEINRDNTKDYQLSSYDTLPTKINYYKYTIEKLYSLAGSWALVKGVPSQYSVNALIKEYNQFNEVEFSKEAETAREDAKKILRKYHEIDQIKKLAEQ